MNSILEGGDDWDRNDLTLKNSHYVKVKSFLALQDIRRHDYATCDKCQRKAETNGGAQCTVQQQGDGKYPSMRLIENQSFFVRGRVLGKLF